MKVKVLYIFLSLLTFGLIICTVFSIAGTVNLPFVWAVFGVQSLASIIGILSLDPGLLAERLHPKGKDRDPLGRIIVSLLYLLHYGIAAYDLGCLHWTDKVPEFLQVSALLPLTLAWAGIIWSMYVNKFFSSAIRLQPDRGQHVISSGPYAWIRHPGYAFASLAFLADAIALGSWLSLIPQAILILYLVHRTNLEEVILVNDLAGYAEYRQNVRYRWVPGVW